MNPFVNPKKRGIQLPKGSNDLGDILQNRQQQPQRKPKCEYCGAFAMALSSNRWCQECQKDLKEYAAKQEFKFDFDTDDQAAVSRFRTEIQRRQDDFMRQRIKTRNSQ